MSEYPERHIDFHNLGAEEQTRVVVAQAAAVTLQLEKLQARLESMGATARAMDIREAQEYIRSAVEEF